MNVEVTTQDVRELSCDALIVGAVRRPREQGEDILLSHTATIVDGLLDEQIRTSIVQGEFSASLGELLTIHTLGRVGARRVVVVGLGSQQRLTPQTLRRASASAALHVQNTGAHKIVLALSVEQTSLNTAQIAQAQVEGALLGTYTFKAYRAKKNNSAKSGISHISLLTQSADTAQVIPALRKAQVLAEATNFARDLVNEPPNVLTPGELVQRAQTMAQRVGLACEVLEKAKIVELGMGGLLAVSQGSAQHPYFLILRYHGDPENTAHHLALVGKGITFDTGGISIKPADHMDEMKGDMAGAAAVIGTMQAIASLQPRINVTALIPTCENMPSGTAYRPGDILRALNKTTIEIVNTDAEGRLILADALSYAAKEGLSPIIDVATLTGGIVIALGNTMSGLFCNDESLTHEILAAGYQAGEKFWAMPLDEEYGEQIKSDIADIKQVGGRAASSITAAKILECFIGEAKWAHLDIAGTSYVESKQPYQEKGATGVGVRTLTELVLQRAEK